MNLLDPPTAAQRLGLVPGTLANWRFRGIGPRFVRVNRQIRYDPRDLDAWVDERKVGSTSEALAA